MRHSLSVIVACYNEEKNIARTLKRISRVAPYAEIIAVDDGSTDNTSEAAKKTGIKNLKVIRYRRNMGKGYAIRKGADAAKGTIQAQVDADSQFPPEELPRLLKPIFEDKADIVFASRFVKGSAIQKGAMTRMRRAANFVVYCLSSAVKTGNALSLVTFSPA